MIIIININIFTIPKYIMEPFKNALMNTLIKFVMPSSPAFGNNIPFVKDDSLSETISSLKVGDIILTKTNNSVYKATRDFLKTQYDHICVVINSKQVIHISPPIISKIQISHIFHKTREPLVLRINDQVGFDKELYLGILNNYLGEKYNEKAIFEIFKRQFLKNFEIFDHIDFSVQTIKYNKICTDSILYALCRSSEKITASIQLYVQKTNFNNLGFFLPQEIHKFLIEQNLASIIHKSPQNVDKTIYEQAFRLTENLKGIMNNEITSLFSRIQKKKNKKSGNFTLLQIFKLITSRKVSNSLLNSLGLGSFGFIFGTVIKLAFLYAMNYYFKDDLQKMKSIVLKMIIKVIGFMLLSRIFPNTQKLGSIPFPIPMPKL